MKNKLILFAFFLALLGFSSYSYALCVSVPEANLRSGPGTKYKKTWEVFKYMPFKKVSAQGDWYKVKDVDGDAHWVFRKLITEKYKCAVVKVDRVNVRSGAGTNYSKSALSPALKYDSFRVIKIKSKWVNVEDEFGDKGWIFRNLLWIN